MSKIDAEKLIVCCYEDRPVAMDALMIMGESLCRNDPGIALHLTVPDAPRNVAEWAARHPQVKLRTARPGDLAGWNVKPRILLEELDSGAPQALWLDDDIVVTRAISGIIRSFPPDAFIVAEEWTQITVCASSFWNLPTGRTVPLFNNCLIRVTQQHRALLERWAELLRDPRYLEAQKLPWNRRPLEASHDGWPLVALLESEEFAHLPYAPVRRGAHIAQCAGSSAYRPGDRVLDLFRGLPPLIHGLGRKPWDTVAEPSASRRFLLDLAIDVSPYVLASRKIAPSLGINPVWIQPRTTAGRLLRAVTAGHPALAGLPLSMAQWLAR